MAVEQFWIDPRLSRLPPTRLQGADPGKLQRQLSKHGKSLTGMPPIEVYRAIDGELVIWNGVTRAVRAAKFCSGEVVLVEVIGPSRMHGLRCPYVGDRLP